MPARNGGMFFASVSTRMRTIRCSYARLHGADALSPLSVVHLDYGKYAFAALRRASTLTMLLKFGSFPPDALRNLRG